MKFTYRAFQFALAAAFISLAGCGGGGDSPANAPFPEFHETTFPTGARIDVSSLNLFPHQAGDSILYDKTEAGVASGTVTRVVSVPADTTDRFIVDETESTSPGDPDRSTYAVNMLGTEMHLQLLDPLVVADLDSRIAAGVPSIEEYMTPLFPVDGVRSVTSQGATQNDFDGDGKSESYRFQYTQVFRGFETSMVLGVSRQVAHFTNTAAFTIRVSSNGADTLMSFIEDAYYAQGVGLVRRNVQVTDPNGATTVSTFEARSASVGGVAYP